LEAERAAFMADYIPRVEREANRNPRKDAELFRDLALHHFNQTAREILNVCRSVEEYEEALINEIPRFVLFTLAQYPFLAEPLKEEMAQGFLFYCLRVNPWANIPEENPDKVWHVGAITGRALSHAGLRWRADALRRAAAGQLTNAESLGEMESEFAPSRDSLGADATKEGASARESFVMPLLKKKGWSILDWANESKVDYHTADDYLKGQTNPYPSTRRKLGDALGVLVEELPQ
jgi:lambda repressor-like predicted transcriptional regulator